MKSRLIILTIALAVVLIGCTNASNQAEQGSSADSKIEYQEFADAKIDANKTTALQQQLERRLGEAIGQMEKVETARVDIDDKNSTITANIEVNSKDALTDSEQQAINAMIKSSIESDLEYTVEIVIKQ